MKFLGQKSLILHTRNNGTQMRLAVHLDAYGNADFRRFFNSEKS